MIPQKFGRIVNFSTLAIPLHLEGAAAYASSKSAVVEMTKILAKELATVGITCNIIAPSLYMSPPAKLLGEEWAEKLLSKQSVSRTAEIEDIANVVSFFISPASSMVTGQEIALGLVT
jgi:3-oxoacyl-[acyl-carrier protein] reductase